MRRGRERDELGKRKKKRSQRKKRPWEEGKGERTYFVDGKEISSGSGSKGEAARTQHTKGKGSA